MDRGLSTSFANPHEALTRRNGTAGSQNLDSIHIGMWTTRVGSQMEAQSKPTELRRIDGSPKTPRIRGATEKTVIIRNLTVICGTSREARSWRNERSMPVKLSKEDRNK